jgi:HAD superfamily hydrolase (TIGR01509 family)
VVFDFDGLIIDTEGPEYEAWCSIYRDHGKELPLDLWTAGIGTRNGFDPYGHLETLHGSALDRTLLSSGVRERALALIAAEIVRPGVVDVLDAAREMDLRIGLASSATRDWVEGHLARLGLLSRFHHVSCWAEGLRPKPAPDLYLEAVEALGVLPSEAIAFEDSANGISAAKAAGLYCVAIPNPLTAGLRLDHADLRLGSLADLPLADLIDRLVGSRTVPGTSA